MKLLDAVCAPEGYKLDLQRCHLLAHLRERVALKVIFVRRCGRCVADFRVVIVCRRTRAHRLCTRPRGREQ